MTGFKKIDINFDTDNLDTFFLQVLNAQQIYKMLDRKYEDIYFLDYVITKGDNIILLQVYTIVNEDISITLYIYDLNGELLDIFQKID